MWTYEQRTGNLTHDGTFLAAGYSGAGSGKNNPALQNVRDVGPVPQGAYTIGAPIDTEEHGPYVLPLTPAASNDMFGRAGFLMHGDSLEHPGAASEGCIVLSRAARTDVWNSGDRELTVVDVLPYSSPAN
jgi:hypothetical protein